MKWGGWEWTNPVDALGVRLDWMWQIAKEAHPKVYSEIPSHPRILLLLIDQKIADRTSPPFQHLYWEESLFVNYVLSQLFWEAILFQKKWTSTKDGATSLNPDKVTLYDVWYLEVHRRSLHRNFQRILCQNFRTQIILDTLSNSHKLSWFINSSS